MRAALKKAGCCVVACGGSANFACVPQLFQQFINTTLRPVFLKKFAVYPFNYKLFIKILSSSLNTTLIVDKHYSVVCCDEFPMPEIDRKCE